MFPVFQHCMPFYQPALRRAVADDKWNLMPGEGMASCSELEASVMSPAGDRICWQMLQWQKGLYLGLLSGMTNGDGVAYGDD